MTSAQRQLYSAALRIARAFGTGGSTWRRTRASGGTPSSAPALAQDGGIVIRFCENNLPRAAQALANVAIYSSPYWGVASADVDIQPNDIFDNGALAFLITGTPDSSQGFLIAPAVPTSVQRSVVLQAAAGFRAGLRVGAW